MAGGSIPSQLAPVFQAAGRANNIPPEVLAGISSVESNLFRNTGPSSAGAVGGMQFLPSTARGLGINPLDPVQAINGAAKLLVQYGYHQNPTRAIAAYNAGPENYQAGLGYAQQVASEAARLRGQLGSGTGVAAPQGAPSAVSAPGMAAAPQATFDQQGYQQALQKFVAGQAVKQAGGSGNPYNSSRGTSKGFSASLGGTSSPLFAQGLLTTSQPNAQDFVKTVQAAHNALQGVAGTSLSVHPALRSGTVAGGFLPKGATYIAGRKDQGRDGQTNPGGPLVANGNGVVVAVKSDPNGFGPAYPEIRFTTGPFAGRTIYFGHTLSTVRPGQQVQPGQVISRTGTSGVGNASVPGWFEVGFADSGTPGPVGQPAPF